MTKFNSKGLKVKVTKLYKSSSGPYGNFSYHNIWLNLPATHKYVQRHITLQSVKQVMWKISWEHLDPMLITHIMSLKTVTNYKPVDHPIKFFDKGRPIVLTLHILCLKSVFFCCCFFQDKQISLTSTMSTNDLPSWPYIKQAW